MKRVVIMHWYAEFIELKRTSVRNEAFVRRIHRDEANECDLFVRREIRLHSNRNAKPRIRLVVFSLAREVLKAVYTYSEQLWAI